MRIAIGQPLQEVSETVLKGISSKNLKSGLRKYNGDKSKGYNVVKKRGGANDYRSPNRGGEGDEELNFGNLSRNASNFLTDISTGASSKMSLIKM